MRRGIEEWRPAGLYFRATMSVMVILSVLVCGFNAPTVQVQLRPVSLAARTPTEPMHSFLTHIRSSRSAYVAQLFGWCFGSIGYIFGASRKRDYFAVYHRDALSGSQRHRSGSSCNKIAPPCNVHAVHDSASLKSSFRCSIFTQAVLSRHPLPKASNRMD